MQLRRIYREDGDIHALIQVGSCLHTSSIQTTWMGGLKEAAAKDDSTWREHWCSGVKTTFHSSFPCGYLVTIRFAPEGWQISNVLECILNKLY
jgi:hypothetical protein